MTIYELGLEYGRSAALLRDRIAELKRAERETCDEVLRLEIAGRLRPLQAMYRETRAVARHLEHYYIHGSADWKRRTEQ